MSAAARIPPAVPPYPAEVQARFDALMPPGVAPLQLFRVLARDQRLFQRFMGGGLLDRGHLTLAPARGRHPPGDCALRLRIRMGRACRVLRQARGTRCRAAPLHGARHRRRRLLERRGSLADPLLRCPARALRCRRRVMGRAARQLQRGGDARAAAARGLLPHRLVSHQRPAPAARGLRATLSG